MVKINGKYLCEFTDEEIIDRLMNHRYHSELTNNLFTKEWNRRQELRKSSPVRDESYYHLTEEQQTAMFHYLSILG